MPASSAKSAAGSYDVERYRSPEPKDGKAGKTDDRRDHEPYRDQSSGHRVALRLGIEMRDDPPPYGYIGACGDQIGILTGGLLAAHGDPAQTGAGSQKSRGREPGEPKRHRHHPGTRSISSNGVKTSVSHPSAAPKSGKAANADGEKLKGWMATW